MILFRRLGFLSWRSDLGHFGPRVFKPINKEIRKSETYKFLDKSLNFSASNIQGLHFSHNNPQVFLINIIQRQETVFPMATVK